MGSSRKARQAFKLGVCSLTINIIIIAYLILINIIK